MAESKYALDLESLKQLSELEFSQAVSSWVLACSSSPVSIAIEQEALQQIQAYETAYGLTSSEIQKRAEYQEFFKPEIEHWLMLIESYPECLRIE